jgi:hypothetical protein
VSRESLLVQIGDAAGGMALTNLYRAEPGRGMQSQLMRQLVERGFNAGVNRENVPTIVQNNEMREK